MPTQLLREFKDDGIISRKIFAEIKPRFEYTLTDFGLTLSPIIQSMAKWGEEYRLQKGNEGER